ncbi:IclR family transcriptional regulator [Nocardioides acrostichi]|uniref:IclR family transcriptional regulator n=1 Tax=Nocardioides acrostichi TaxID=2784339 RepID=A0A930UZX8_9ACTN|nr:IclR family transcriptional regulator [Nocardioides acrostichi]MBF4161326.1 IclR family transcriptional regulator [Nocardioides acrostichi]
MPRSSDGSRSLSTRTMDVLGAFGAGHTALTLSELARAADLSLTTTHRIARDLAAWGALERSTGGRWRVGLRLWEVAAHAPRALPLREAALPAMEDLYEATHENVQLAVREGLEVVWLERLTGRGSVRVLTRVGGRFALHATGVGLVLLAHAPASVQDQVFDAPLRRWTAQTITDPVRLRAQLAEIRRTGIAVSEGQVTDDAVSVAAPVRDGEQVVAAVSVVMHNDGPLSVAAVAPAVRATARAISRAHTP